MSELFWSDWPGLPPPWRKFLDPRMYHVYMGLYMENIKQFSFLKPQNLESWYSRDRRDVTALATQVNKCTAVMWTVNFNITDNGKMMKNWPYLINFTDFFIRLRLFRKENIVFCSATIILIIISPIFHKLLRKIGCGWGERPSVCDHLDVKEMSVSNILGALTH